MGDCQLERKIKTPLHAQTFDGLKTKQTQKTTLRVGLPQAHELRSAWSLQMVNEDFEDVFDAALATQIAFQQPAKGIFSVCKSSTAASSGLGVELLTPQTLRAIQRDTGPD